MVRLSYVNVFTRNLKELPDFYINLFALSELEDQKSPIFRALSGGGAMIGFNAPAAYAFLGLADTSDERGGALFLTFDVADAETVTHLTQRATELGARLVKPPYETSYGTFQSVVRDPEDNVFRINAPLMGPLSNTLAEMSNPPDHLKPVSKMMNDVDPNQQGTK